MNEKLVEKIAFITGFILSVAFNLLFIFTDYIVEIVVFMAIVFCVVRAMCGGKAL